MYVTGHDVQSLVEFNTYDGLEAQVKLTEWKKGMTPKEINVREMELLHLSTLIKFTARTACEGLVGF